MLIPFGVPVHAEGAGIIPAGSIFFNNFGLRGIWEMENSRGFYGTGTEKHGKSDVSTGTVWMGTGYQDFFGNCLDGITGTIFAREREKNHFP